MIPAFLLVLFVLLEMIPTSEAAKGGAKTMLNRRKNQRQRDGSNRSGADSADQDECKIINFYKVF